MGVVLNEMTNGKKKWIDHEFNRRAVYNILKLNKYKDTGDTFSCNPRFKLAKT